MQPRKLRIGDKVRRKDPNSWFYGDKVVTVSWMSTDKTEIQVDEYPQTWYACYFELVEVVVVAVAIPVTQKPQKHEWIGKKILLKRWKAYFEVHVCDVRDNGKAVKAKFDNGSYGGKHTWITVDGSENEYTFVTIL